MSICTSKSVLSVLILGLAPAAFAQQELANEDEETILEEVIVYAAGYTDSLRKSLNVKRQGSEVMEALAAEDLGQLPDISVVESLGRLPGVTVIREVAGAGAVSIRGMGSVLSNGTLNGRDVASTSGDRRVPFELFPPELVTGAAVYKAPRAGGIEGGVAGTIDLRTIKPLDVPNRDIAMNFRARYNDFASDLPDGESVGYRGSINYINQFADDTVGVAFGYAGQYAPFVSGESSLFNLRRVEWGGYINGMPGGYGDTYDINVQYGADNGISSGTSERHAVLGVVQWRMSDDLELNLDAFVSDFSSRGENVGLQAEGYGSWGNDWSDVEWDGYNVISGTVTCNRPPNECYGYWGQDLRALSALDSSDATLSNVGAELIWDHADWTMKGNFAYSLAEEANFFGNLAFRPYHGEGESLERDLAISTFGENDRSAAFIVSPLDFANQATNRIDNYRIYADNDLEDEIYSFRADAERAFSGDFLTSVSFGVRYVTRENTSNIRRNSAPLSALDSVAVTPEMVRGTFSLEDANSAFDTNPVLLLRTRAIINQYFPGVSSVLDPIASAVINEDVSSAYVQFDFAREFGNWLLSGNFGVRYVTTDVETSGTQGFEGDLTPITTSDDYSHTLPSLNVNLWPNDGLVFRLGLATTMARPPVSFLSPGTEQWGDAVYGGAGGGGNPYLRPYEADQVDIAVEKYFSENTALTLALFYKDLDTFITQSVIETGPPQNLTAYVPANASGGYIRGWEILWQQQFQNLLPENWGEFGVYLNYSHTESDIRITETFDSGDYGLDGLSENVGNLTLHWDKGPVSARVSYRYRDDFTRPQRPGRAFITNAEESDLSFQISWQPADAWTIVLQGWNLTDEPRDSYYGLDYLQGQYRVFGRNFEIGLTYRM